MSLWTFDNFVVVLIIQDETKAYIWKYIVNTDILDFILEIGTHIYFSWLNINLNDIIADIWWPPQGLQPPQPQCQHSRIWYHMVSLLATIWSHSAQEEMWQLLMIGGNYSAFLIILLYLWTYVRQSNIKSVMIDTIKRQALLLTST